MPSIAGVKFKAFFQALFIGAVFQFFAAIILGIWAFAYGAITKDAQPSVKKTINHLVGIVALCVVGFALVCSSASSLVAVSRRPNKHGKGRAPGLFLIRQDYTIRFNIYRIRTKGAGKVRHQSFPRYRPSGSMWKVNAEDLAPSSFVTHVRHVSPTLGT